ncbi:sigma-54-dependent transcriptional regulator [Tunicatimonas pelagia]|uniref:sigma-54-dependent transcriptional regulator n=1 Tax=Tunicatimonas pelagia TaxID=931531 RepID=UPI002665292B|nr:sigma-54 dependent transcriptional regulator [Tunicatimonas pelagia]WKN40895.1 sigma-54 dependent transcriptional regulator [Tunicatimonas pelagia]
MDIQGNSILIVEDEASIRSLLAKILGLEGYKIFEASDVASGREILRNETIHLLLTDVNLPDANGIDFTKYVKKEYPLIEVVVLTAFSNVKDGVQAMKLGAFDYLAKGDGDERLPLVVQKAMEKAVLNRKLQEMEFRLDSKSSFAKIVGSSQSVQRMLELAKKVAVTDTTVLLLGETGTGKELLAEAIHLASRRRKGNFVAINCAAIPKDLQESELFGHKKGSFTGASSDKKGYFEAADRGTIFLDELGEMSPELQAKLLRVLETRMLNRVGETEPIPVDIRIIAATNRELVNDDNEAFRRDLYYRLSAFTIDLPALRDRKEDIDVLVMHLLKEHAERANKSISSIDPEFLDYLKRYNWPGNIRELRNVVERAVILADTDRLTPDALPNEILHQTAPVTVSSPASNHTPVSSGGSPATVSYAPDSGLVDLKSVEQAHILKTLESTNGNKSEAAKRLDIGLATLYRKLKEYNISS